jgi:hypothetical protein
LQEKCGDGDSRELFNVQFPIFIRTGLCTEKAISKKDEKDFSIGVDIPTWQYSSRTKSFPLLD